MAEKRKPERRKSALSKLSPVAPPPESVTPNPAPTPSPAPAPASTEGEQEKTAWPKKESYYPSPGLAERMRSAHLNTMMTEDGQRSLSAFTSAAVMERVERLEAKYNDGKPWPPVGKDQIPKGPPPRI